MNTQKRVAKQYLIVNEKNIRVNYGTTDKRNPSVIYARAKGSVQPFEEKRTYATDIQDLKRTFKDFVKERVNLLPQLKTEKLLCNIEITENGLSFKKKGHMRYEIFIKPMEIKQLEEYEGDIKQLTEEVNLKIRDFLKERGIKTF